MGGPGRMRCRCSPPLNAMRTAPHTIHFDGFPRCPLAACRRIAAAVGRQTPQDLGPRYAVGVISNHGLDVDGWHRAAVTVGVVGAWEGDIRRRLGPGGMDSRGNSCRHCPYIISP